MRYFTAILHQEGDSAYGLSFPDLPGCFAAADDWEESPAAAAEALDLWFEDRPDAPSSPLHALRKTPEVIEALAAGGVLILIPYARRLSGAV